MAVILDIDCFRGMDRQAARSQLV